RTRVVGVLRAVVLELSPATVQILHPRQPVARSERRLQTLRTAQLHEAGQHPVHDLTGVEYDRLAAQLAEMPGKCAVGALNRELPVDDALSAIDQVGTIEHLRGRKERLDDVSACFRITRKPAIFEAPARRHATGIGLVVAYVLRQAQPVYSRGKMGGLRGLRIQPADQGERAQPRVARTPRPATERSGE